jgi:hypothetical protein
MGNGSAIRVLVWLFNMTQYSQGSKVHVKGRPQEARLYQ